MSECAMNIQMYVWLANQIDLVSMNDSQKEKKNKNEQTINDERPLFYCVYSE